MAEQKLKIEAPSTVDGITLIPVVRIEQQGILKPNSLYLHLVKEPVALIVLNGSVRKAYIMNGKEIPFEILFGQIPELAEFLDNYLSQNPTDK